MRPLILVTGATGYIAGRLIPQLLSKNYQVRALARDPMRLINRKWFQDVEKVSGDIMKPDTLTHALQGVSVAYYLIHNMLSGHGYTERELEGARNFTQAAERAGVQHIIYLGGLADPEQHIAPHMRSRIETGQVLREGKIPVTEFRAGVIAGSGSISFEMIRFMTEAFPIVPGPAWLNNQSQPIAVQNVIDYLLAALESPDGHGKIFEIGGPHTSDYKDLMLKYARVRGLKRSILIFPYIPLKLMAFGVGLFTPVPPKIAHALIGGLSADSVVKHPDVLDIFPEISLINFEQATSEALQELAPGRIERIWSDDLQKTQSIKHEGFFILHKTTRIFNRKEEVFGIIEQLAQKIGGHVEITITNDHLRVGMDNHSVGDQWLEWSIRQDGNKIHLGQTFFFAPYGLPGFGYWYLLQPFRALWFRNLFRKLALQCNRMQPLHEHR